MGAKFEFLDLNRIIEKGIFSEFIDINMAPLENEIAELAVTDINESMDTLGSGGSVTDIFGNIIKWPKIKQSTIDSRKRGRKKRGSNQYFEKPSWPGLILYRTGALRSNIKAVGGDIFSTMEYSYHLEWRFPFLFYSSYMEEQIVDLVNKYYS